MWVRADSTNGYVSQFQVYTGKESSSTEKGLGSRVVKDLTATIQHRNHHVYCDNFFSVFNSSLIFYLLAFMPVER